MPQDKYINECVDWFNQPMVRKHLSYQDITVMAVEEYVRNQPQNHRMALELFKIAEKGAGETVLPVCDQIVLHLNDTEMTRLMAMKLKAKLQSVILARDEADALLQDQQAIKDFITECGQSVKRFHASINS